MGKLDLEARDEHQGRPLFDSLKHVWLSSLPVEMGSENRSSPPPDYIIVSEPPPARVLP